MKNFKYLLILISATVLLACSKDKPEENVPAATPTGSLLLHLHTYLDENEVDGYGFQYTMTDGRAIKLSMAQFFISGIELVKMDGSTLAVSTKFMKTQKNSVYEIPNVPVGNYKGIRFKVGLDAETNAMSAGKDTALLGDENMWFHEGGATGYKFLSAYGMIDTSADFSGKMAEFQYSVGTNANYTQVVMPEQAFSVIKGSPQYLHMLADYYKLFDGLNLSNNENLYIVGVDGNSTPIAAKIKANIPSMFRYQKE